MKILVFISTCGKDEFEGQSSLNQSPTSLATQFSKTTHADIKYTEYLPLHAIFFLFSTTSQMHILRCKCKPWWLTRAIINIFSNRVVRQKPICIGSCKEEKRNFRQDFIK